MRFRILDIEQRIFRLEKKKKFRNHLTANSHQSLKFGSSGYIAKHIPYIEPQEVFNLELQWSYH